MITPNIIESDLIATLSKHETLSVLRDWRNEAESKDAADAFTDVIHLIIEGELDG